jgi:ribosome-binding protein aMBF1 (putative translation factor)
MLTCYPDCDLTRPDVPPRSRLYGLALHGIGTPLVEGLLSYVIRLADAHAVTPAMLITHEVLPYLHPEPGVHPATTRLHHLWRDYGSVLNGFRQATVQWSTLLAQLTSQTTLTAGTLLAWQAVLAPTHLLRRTHAWCPHCYAHWRAAGLPLYAPLLWSLAVVTVCPQHGTPMQEHCPACAQAIPCLHRQARMGYCPHCATMLTTIDDPAPTAPDPWACWVARQVGALLAAPQPQPQPDRGHVAAVVQAAGQQLSTWTQVTELARRLGVRSSAVTQWRTGMAVPELESWLRLAAVLGTSLQTVLTCVPAPPVADTYPALPDRPTLPPRAQRRRLFDQAAVAAHLTEVLADTHAPPPSMRAVGRQLGYADSQIRQYFPDQCRAISARYLAYRRARQQARRQQVDADIRAAVATLDAQGQYPTLTAVAALVRDPGTVRDPLARQVWRAELERLGWRTKSGSPSGKNNP